jgi:hypothetical protein
MSCLMNIWIKGPCSGLGSWLIALIDQAGLILDKQVIQSVSLAVRLLLSSKVLDYDLSKLTHVRWLHVPGR